MDARNPSSYTKHQIHPYWNQIGFETIQIRSKNWQKRNQHQSVMKEDWQCKKKLEQSNRSNSLR